MAEIHHPDGRVELDAADLRTLQDSPLYNPDLAPVPLPERTWTTYNFAALWISMAHCIPTYTLAATLIAIFLIPVTYFVVEHFVASRRQRIPAGEGSRTPDHNASPNEDPSANEQEAK